MYNEMNIDQLKLDSCFSDYTLYTVSFSIAKVSLYMNPFILHTEYKKYN